MASELERLTRGVLLAERHRYYFVSEGRDDLVWLVPIGFLAGVTEAYGIPVKHVEGLTEPWLAHSFKPWDLDEVDQLLAGRP